MSDQEIDTSDDFVARREYEELLSRLDFARNMLPMCPRSIVIGLLVAMVKIPLALATASDWRAAECLVETVIAFPSASGFDAFFAGVN